MSLISIYSHEFTNGINRRAMPADDFDLKRAIHFARHIDSCSDLMQRDYPTELLLRYGNKRKRSRRTNKPFFPIKEEITVCPTKIPKYVAFSCRHFNMYANLRYGIDEYFISMFT